MFDTEKFLADMQDFEIDTEMKKLKIDPEKGYKILNEDQAIFFLKRYQECMDDIAKIKELCEQRIADYTKEIEEYRDSKLKEYTNNIEYFSYILNQYYDDFMAANPNTKKKSIKLPYGTLAMKKSLDKYNIADEEKLVKFLQTIGQDELLNTTSKTTVNKKLLKTKVTHTDEGVFIGDNALPDVTFEPGKDKFSINLNSK